MSAGDDIDSDEFLEDGQAIEGASFTMASGVRWADLAAAVVGSIAAAATLGVQSVVGGIVEAVTGLLGGVETFITGTNWSVGLFDLLTNAMVSALSGVWDISLSDWGIFATVALTLIIFGSLWTFSQAADYIREEVL